MIFQITTHAAQRYQQRVRPALGVEDAEVELRRLLNTVGQVVPGKPEWLNTRASQADTWLVIGPDLAVACERREQGIYRVLTVLARGHISDDKRAHRTATKRVRRPERYGPRRRAA